MTSRFFLDQPLSITTPVYVNVTLQIGGFVPAPATAQGMPFSAATQDDLSSIGLPVAVRRAAGDLTLEFFEHAYAHTTIGGPAEEYGPGSAGTAAITVNTNLINTDMVRTQNGGWTGMAQPPASAASRAATGWDPPDGTYQNVDFEMYNSGVGNLVYNFSAQYKPPEDGRFFASPKLEMVYSVGGTGFFIDVNTNGATGLRIKDIGGNVVAIDASFGTNAQGVSPASVDFEWIIPMNSMALAPINGVVPVVLGYDSSLTSGVNAMVPFAPGEEVWNDTSFTWDASILSTNML